MQKEPAVKVDANARLHMGFLDLHGGLGRQFGSIGVALDQLSTTVTVAAITDGRPYELTGSGADLDRALRYAEVVRASYGSEMPLSINVENAIPPHAGLGSGTQMALAVGLGISRVLGRHDSEEEIALLLGRGKRSAIGISCFRHGGFVVDGGRGETSSLPPTLIRLPFPDQWRLILLFDRKHLGVHGDEEVRAFQNLPQFPESTAAHLCRLTLMRLVPAVVEKDVAAFGAAITEIQQLVGDHFAPVQGGRFASPGVRKYLHWFEQQSAPGLGQSSWGPTGFIVCANQKQAEQWVERAQQEVDDNDVELRIFNVNNDSGCITRLNQ